MDRRLIRWGWACFWAWLWHYSPDKVRYQIELLHDSASYTPGETPASVLHQVALHADIGPGTRVLDIGCGRGTALAYWTMVHGAIPIGIEEIPALIGVSKALFTQVSQPILLIEGDFCELEWPSADVIYVAATCFSPSALKELIYKLRYCDPGTRIAVITIELPEMQFECIAQIPVRFAWGGSMLRVYRNSPPPQISRPGNLRGPLSSHE